MKLLITYFILCSWIALNIIPTQAAGLGFEYQSVEVIARGNTAVANIHSSSSVHYNPGALSFLKSPEVEVNFLGVLGGVSWDNGKETYHSSGDLKVFGTLFTSCPFQLLGEDWFIGVGFTRPYGQSVTYPLDHPARNFGYEGEMDYQQYSLALSHRINEKVGLGVAVNYATSQLVSKRGLVLPSDESVFDGRDDAFSAHFGILYQPMNSLRLGLSYRTGFDLSHQGEFSYTSNSPFVPRLSTEGEVNFSLPSHVMVGLEWDTTSKLTLSCQIQWSEWSVVDSFISRAGEIEEVIFSEWDDGWMYSVGLSYQLNQSVILHAGYIYSPEIVDDEFQSLLFADFDSHVFSVGVSVLLDKYELHGAVSYLIALDEKIINSNYANEGIHQSDAFFVNIGLTRTF